MIAVSGAEMVKMIVAYDGGDFHGFQRQREEPTVQSSLERALSEVNRAEVSIQGAGRTDAGVHARGQVVAFRPRVQIPLHRWPRAVNRLLPSGLVVRSAESVGQDFDPVRHARWKHYRYEISCGENPSPFERRYVCWLPTQLSVSKMQCAGHRLLGRHDFSSFQVSGRPVASPVRSLYQLAVHRQEGRIITDMVADGFLYKMARSIVGTLIYVGEGRIMPEEMRDILRERNRSRAGPTAPAQGLYMLRVQY